MKQHIAEPSSFAEFVSNNLINPWAMQLEDASLIELGCGNGRDAIFFANLGVSVTAVDQATNGIEKKLVTSGKLGRLPISIIEDDFVNGDYTKGSKFDIVYSRFTIHSISSNDEDILIDRLPEMLKNNGIICIEVRSDRDPLCGVGEYLGDGVYLTDHHRRFISSKKLVAKLLKNNFSLLFFDERSGLSVYKDDDPVLIRLIMRHTTNGE